MSTPVVLIGLDQDGSLSVVGLYESAGAAHRAVQDGHVPSRLLYSIVTPAMNNYSTLRDVLRSKL